MGDRDEHHYSRMAGTAHFKKYWETTAPMIAKRVARHMSPIAFNIKAR